MKALALRGRGENKDAYDLVYLLRHYPGGVVARMKALLFEDECKEAMAYLRDDFATIDSIGPRRSGEFLHGGRNDESEADAWSAVQDLFDTLA